ncbi:MAG TPA: hypothetical protein VGF22_20090, partial [Acidimicrobiales bacterium]
MPVAQTQSRRALVVGISGVLAGAVLVVVVLLAGNTRKEIKFGSDTFTAGSAASLARSVPLIFPDPVNGDRPIFLQHLGPGVNHGWLAFDAQVDGCPLSWDAKAKEFVDTCTKDRYPADGTGLHQYPVSVRNGRVT